MGFGSVRDLVGGFLSSRSCGRFLPLPQAGHPQEVHTHLHLNQDHHFCNYHLFSPVDIFHNLLYSVAFLESLSPGFGWSWESFITTAPSQCSSPSSPNRMRLTSVRRRYHYKSNANNYIPPILSPGEMFWDHNVLLRWTQFLRWMWSSGSSSSWVEVQG